VAWAHARVKQDGGIVRIRWCPRCGREERDAAEPEPANGRLDT
jgi:hypothetical protein